MSDRTVPHPFPIRLRDQVNSDLRSAEIIDSEARFVIRRMIADAYAQGFYDGRTSGAWDATTDRNDREDMVPAVEREDLTHK